MAKLSELGFSEGSNIWFKSYLNRTQQLTYNDSISECTRVESGIGQGTIVGPIVFLIYINDVVRILPNIYINMYADDCILYYSGNNWPQVFNRLQQCLINFDEWCVRNGMILNVAKSKCLVIGNRTKLSRVDYSQRLEVRDIASNMLKEIVTSGYIWIQKCC